MAFKPRFTNMVDLLSWSVNTYGELPVFGSRRQNRWEWTSYRTFGAMVDRCRAGLAGRGVTRGDRVAVISGNRMRWAVAAHAIQGLTAIHVPIHRTQSEKEWARILQDCGARLCFVDGDEAAGSLKALRADLHDLEQIVNFDGPRSDPDSFDSLMRYGAARPVEKRIPDPGKDVASIFYTAGVSGNPKGVRLTHFNLASNACALLEASSIRRGLLTVSFLPWAHVLGGAIELNLVMATGGTVAICADPPRLMDYLREIRPTGMFAVPRIWNRMRSGVMQYVASQLGFVQTLFATSMRARAKKRRHQNLSLVERSALRTAEAVLLPRVAGILGGRMSFASSGGAALPLETEEFFYDLGIPIFQGYGLAECSGCATTTSIDNQRFGSVGKPIPGVSIRIESIAEEALEGEGEIVISGTGVMEGYHNLPGETVETTTENGAIRTGDMGRIDEDGFLFITGTLKEVYKLANGRYVAPAPLEVKLQGSPYIAQCMVYGVNQAHNVALIVPDLTALSVWGTSNGMSPFVHTLVKDSRTRRLFEEEIAKQSRDFKSFERVRNFALIRTELSSSDGTVSAAHRLKRRAIVEKYQKTLRELYQAL